MSNRVLRSVAFSIIIGALSARAAELPDVVVTPMRADAPVNEVPYTTYVLGPEQLSAEMPRTTPDALHGLPSVLVQKTAYGQGSPFLRGFTGFRTLMLVDGIRLNNAVFREGPNQYWSTIDPYSIDRYEVLMGPASVQYGSDAIGGTVNAITYDAPEWTGAPEWERSLQYRGATAERSHQGRIALRGRPTEALGFAGGFSLRHFGDLEGGRAVGRQQKTGYDEYGYDGKIEYTVAPDRTLTLARQSVEQDDVWRTHRTPYGIDWEGLARGDDPEHRFDQGRDLTYLRLDANQIGGAVDRVQWTVSLHEQDEDLFRRRVDGRRDEQGFDVSTVGTVLQLESETRAGRLIYGAEYYRDQVDSYGRRYRADGSLERVDVQGPVADDARYQTAGIFIQDVIPVAEGALELTPGVRYTRVDLEADRVTDGRVRDEDWDQVSASLRALAPFGNERQHAVFAGVSQGFRAPNLSDLTRFDTARSTEFEVPVESLDPEHYLSWEAGTRWSGETVDASLTWYYTDIEDLIVRTPTGVQRDSLSEITKRNAGEGHVQGVELMTEWRMDTAWTVRGMACWMEGRVEAYPTSEPVQVEDDLSRVMPETMQLALRYQPEGVIWWAEGVVDAAAKADRLSADDARDTQRIPPGGTPGYVVGTLRGGAQIGEDLDVVLALENVADVDYRFHGSGVNEPGRQLVMSASYTF